MVNSPYSEEVLRETGVAPFVDNSQSPRATRERQGVILRRWESERERMQAAAKLDPELIDHAQLERVRKVVDAAFISHPFYQRLYSGVGYSTGDIITWDDYNSLPIVSKAELYEARELFPGRALAASECSSSRTSGSTGPAVTVYQDDAATSASILSYMRYYEQALGRSRKKDEMVYRIYPDPLRYTSFLGDYPLFTLTPACPPNTPWRTSNAVGRSSSKHLPATSPKWSGWAVRSTGWASPRSAPMRS